MKRFSAAAFIFISAFLCFSEGTENQKRFISGNIQDKTQSVRSSSGSEAVLLANLALDFAIENKEILGDDRELDALALSGILAIPSDFMANASDSEKKKLSDDFYTIYNIFSDENVKISILRRLSVFRFSDGRFPSLLNDYLKTAEIKRQNDSLTKAVITALASVGNSDSFVILYLLCDDPVWADYRENIKDSVAKLMENSIPQAISIVQSGTEKDCRQILSLALKNEKFSNKIIAEIAENVLSRSINIYENSLSKSSELAKVQFDSFKVLVDLKWTRSSAAAMRFYSTAKKEYEEGFFPEDDLVWTIENLSSLDPMGSVEAFSSYLSECNSLMENSISNPGVKKPEDKVVLALISALGAIGDKNAFDTLLAVTYYSYPDNIISKARDALASLKW